MKLLITTQIVDEQDPGLGFFCNWLTEFSAHFETIEVICLKEGKHSLPGNVRVHSLGKENRGSSRQEAVGRKIQFAFRFIWLVWKLRKNYDAVFVHMNPEYILLAGDQWRLFGKKVYLWYNHAVGSLALRIAAPLCAKVFHTSSFAYPARYKNAILMPAGIDTRIFAPRTIPRNRNAIYFQGRVAPAKRVHVLLEALSIMRVKNPNATVTVVGPEDREYGKKLRIDFSDLIASGAVRLLGPKKNEETPDLYAAHGVSVNLTASGNFDKSVLESMACETPVVVSSNAFANTPARDWVCAENDPQSLAELILRMQSLDDSHYHSLAKEERLVVEKNHSLSSLGARLAQEITV